MKKFKQRLFEIFEAAKDGDRASKIIDILIMSLIILNVIAVIISTFDLPLFLVTLLNYFEILSIIVFTIEYLARVYTSDLLFPNLSPIKARLKYVFSFMALIDLFAILPFYLPKIFPYDLRIIRSARIMKLLRVFKLNRYSVAFETITTVFKNKRNQLISSTIVVMTMILISSVLMYNIENTAQPDKFTNVFDALWLSIATITTVGYGDIYPITTLGRILGAIIAVLGIALVAVPTSIISSGLSEFNNQKKYQHYLEDSKNIDLNHGLKIKGIYRHFKGNYYLVEDLAIDSETQKKQVIYRPLYGEAQLFVRPYEMFISKVDKEKYPEIKQIYRFELTSILEINNDKK